MLLLLIAVSFHVRDLWKYRNITVIEIDQPNVVEASLFLQTKSVLLEDMEQLVKEEIVDEANKYENVDASLATAIVSCEGGFEDPSNCNKQYGCKAGQGHFQFIPSTWASIIANDAVPLPDRCRTTESVFTSDCNIIAGVYLLHRDGDRHWASWSGSCYLDRI